MITATLIAQVLDQKFKHYFDETADDAKLAEWFKEIAKAITSAPPVPIEAKWITFNKTATSPSGKTHLYQVRSKENPNVLLGEIKWYPAFRCYSFYAKPYTIYETRCMGDIINFIDVLMHLHPKPNKSTKTS